MNPNGKNLIVLLAFITMILGAAIFYSLNIEENNRWPVESGRIPVANSSSTIFESSQLATLQ